MCLIRFDIFPIVHLSFLFVIDLVFFLKFHIKDQTRIVGVGVGVGLDVFVYLFLFFFFFFSFFLFFFFVCLRLELQNILTPTPQRKQLRPIPELHISTYRGRHNDPPSF